MCEVTIAIASYNVEKYIERTLLSAVSQDFNDLEILVIDDCSTDHSFEIVERIKNNVSLSKIIRLHKNEKNCGTAAVRNLCIKMARGRYIFFLDGDDYMPTNSISILYTRAKLHNAEIVSAKFDKFVSESDLAIEKPSKELSDIHSAKGLFAIPQWATQVSTDFYNPGIPCKLYSLEFLRNYDIYCIPEHQVVEDTCFTFLTILHTKSFVQIGEIVLYYRQHPTSATNTIVNSKRMNLYLLVYDDICRLLDQFKNQETNQEIHPFIYQYILHNFVVGFFRKAVFASSQLSKKDKKRYLDHVSNWITHEIKKEYLFERKDIILFQMICSKYRYELITYVCPILRLFWRSFNTIRETFSFKHKPFHLENASQ